MRPALPEPALPRRSGRAGTPLLWREGEALGREWPIDVAQRRVLSRSRHGARGGTADGPDLLQPPPRILVIDDDRDGAEAVAGCLERHGFSVDVVRDG